MFDLDKAKSGSGLNSDVLSRIEQRVRQDFDDEMMFEIHFIRALNALRDGRVTLEQLLDERVPA